MPRAPHKSALFAGNPRANCSVLASKVSRDRSTPINKDKSTRAMWATGSKRSGSTCHTNADDTGTDHGNHLFLFRPHFCSLLTADLTICVVASEPDSHPWWHVRRSCPGGWMDTTLPLDPYIREHEHHDHHRPTAVYYVVSRYDEVYACYVNQKQLDELKKAFL